MAEKQTAISYSNARQDSGTFFCRQSGFVRCWIPSARRLELKATWETLAVAREELVLCSRLPDK